MFITFLLYANAACVIILQAILHGIVKDAAILNVILHVIF